MIKTTVSEIIEIYAWIAASIIMVFLAAIAIFYQKKFGIRTFYYMYGIPIIALFVASIHLFSYDTIQSEMIELFGSATSFLASYYLYKVMVGVKK